MGDMSATAALIPIAAKRKHRNGCKTYLASKCLYHLEPFDAKFEPLIHNEFLASREKKKVELIEADIEKEKIKMINKGQKKKTQSLMRKVSWKRYCFGAFIIGIKYRS